MKNLKTFEEFRYSARPLPAPPESTCDSAESVEEFDNSMKKDEEETQVEPGLENKQDKDHNN